MRIQEQNTIDIDHSKEYIPKHVVKSEYVPKNEYKMTERINRTYKETIDSMHEDRQLQKVENKQLAEELETRIQKAEEREKQYNELSNQERRTRYALQDAQYENEKLKRKHEEAVEALREARSYNEQRIRNISNDLRITPTQAYQKVPLTFPGYTYAITNKIQNDTNNEEYDEE